ncbi:MAG: type II toxin-antitoxin system RelE/ParE family toxin [Cyclobacteriaceae bacterium]|jgi:plasmid stabilization system protein ParE|nr:type II toxin-antitoxin system RelE/ParE family toxin [Flammeovirgaceae bacterium]HAC25913.1 hypothetical protein [Cytophagales bacterium]
MKVVWSPRAQADFEYHLTFLRVEWGESVARKFFDRCIRLIDQITANPRMFVASTSFPDIRRCVVNRKITLYYRIKQDQIELITFWLAQQNPERLDI